MTKQLDINLDDYLKGAQTAALKGREVLLHYFKDVKKIKEKHLAGLVSEADVESEKAIIDYLKNKFPKTEFLAEESHFNEGSSIDLSKYKYPFWVIDPLDGTTNYIHGFHGFCISIGLHIEGITKVAVVDLPVLNQTYYAVKNKGAFVESEQGSRKISVSERAHLSDALLATGFFSQNKEALKEQLDIFSKIVGETRGVRRVGAAAYDLCLVAEGIFDGFWEKNLKPWDTSAGSLLVAEAGGLVTNYSGQEFKLDMDSILASNKILHSQLTQYTSK